MIDFYATEPHFVDHLAPTWAELDPAERGTFWTGRTGTARAEELGIEHQANELPATEQLTVAAAYGDLKRARRKHRRVVLCEHGAGQTYTSSKGVPSGSYLGAPDRAGCVAVLVPGEKQAAVHRRAHPTIPAYPVGTPRLDRWHRTQPTPEAGLVAVSFHWDCRVVPETRSALRFYQRALGTLARAVNLVGHSHPRGTAAAHQLYRRAQVPIVEHFDEVMDRAALYVCDNSSTMFEFASTGRPVVVLNQPAYRRNVDHGMRFWEYADLGLQVDTPARLVDTVLEALTDPPEVAARRAEIIDEVYLHTDGHAAKRAAEALRTIHDQWG